MDREQMLECVQSIRNRCDIVFILTDPMLSRYGMPVKVDKLLPTVLEDMYEDAQKIALEYCAKENI